MAEQQTAENARQGRGYELGKRLDQMEETRGAVLQAARNRLEEQGYRRLSMASLATESGVTRQTIHNLFGTKRKLLEALFDSIAMHGGMEQMRSVMSLEDPNAMLQGFVRVFCGFWAAHQVLFRRIHGIGAIDPDFGEILIARNERRRAAAGRVAKKWKSGSDSVEAAAALTALTSFEFYDVTAQHEISGARAESIILKLASAAIKM